MKNIGDLLGAAGQFTKAPVGADSKAAANEATRLRREVSQCVPAELLDHVLFLRIEEKRLRCTMDSPGWASRIRFHGKAILQQLHAAGVSVNTLSVHVQPQEQNLNLQRKIERKPIPVTPETVQHIEQVAQGVDDENLRKSLLKLAAGMQARRQK